MICPWQGIPKWPLFSKNKSFIAWIKRSLDKYILKCEYNIQTLERQQIPSGKNRYPYFSEIEPFLFHRVSGRIHTRSNHSAGSPHSRLYAAEQQNCTVCMVFTATQGCLMQANIENNQNPWVTADILMLYTVKRVDEVVPHRHLVTQDQTTQVSNKFLDDNRQTNCLQMSN